MEPLEYTQKTKCWILAKKKQPLTSRKTSMEIFPQYSKIDEVLDLLRDFLVDKYEIFDYSPSARKESKNWLCVKSIAKEEVLQRKLMQKNLKCKEDMRFIEKT